MIRHALKFRFAGEHEFRRQVPSHAASDAFTRARLETIRWNQKVEQRLSSIRGNFVQRGSRLRRRFGDFKFLQRLEIEKLGLWDKVAPRAPADIVMMNDIPHLKMRREPCGIAAIGRADRRKQQPVAGVYSSLEDGLSGPGESLHPCTASPLSFPKPQQCLSHPRPKVSRAVPQDFVKTRMDEDGIHRRHSLILAGTESSQVCCTRQS